MAEICGELTLKHIASDGKTMRGSADNKGRLKGRHVGHAFATANGVCLAQKVTAEKSNEITAIPELLKLLDLKKAIVAIDAMGCPREIAAAIVDGQGDYLLAVKGNQGHLYEDVQATLAPMLGGETVPTEAEYAKTENVSRGREEKRICYVSTQREHIRNQAL